MNFFSKNLKYLRKAAELTQNDLAKEVSKQNTSISNWEKGNSIPSIEDIILLSKYFNVRLDLFITVDIEKAGLIGGPQKDDPEENSREYDSFDFPDQQVNEPDEPLLTKVLGELKKLNGNVGKLRVEVKKKIEG